MGINMNIQEGLSQHIRLYYHEKLLTNLCMPCTSKKVQSVAQTKKYSCAKNMFKTKSN